MCVYGEKRGVGFRAGLVTEREHFFHGHNYFIQAVKQIVLSNSWNSPNNINVYGNHREKSFARVYLSSSPSTSWILRVKRGRFFVPTFRKSK